MKTLFLFIIALISYFIGCFNGSIIISRFIWKKDIREYGSGNAGLTNFYRTFGLAGLILVAIMDIGKAILAVLIGGLIMGKYGYAGVGKLFAGFCVMLGHSYPALFELRGGKGILSALGVALMVNWKVALICLAIFIVIVIFTRYVSLGSVVAAALFPLLLLIFKHSGLECVLALFCALLAIFNHRTNIARLVNGNESRFELKRGR